MGLLNQNGAGAAPNAGASVTKQGKSDRTRAREEFQKKGRDIRMRAKQTGADAGEGEKSGNVEFVCALSTDRKKSPKDSTPQPLGYRFKNVGKETINVPVAPLNFPKAKNEYDRQPVEVTTIPAAPGAIFDLNMVETAILISSHEYAGSFSGGGKTVNIVPIVSEANAEPRPILKSADKSFSVRANAVVVDEKLAGNKRYTIKQEFSEKFGSLYVQPSADGAANQTVRNTAAAFRDMYHF